MRFKRARMRCQTLLPETKYIKFVVGGLNFELRRKFEGVNLINLIELSEKASRYESLLKEENQRRNSSMRTYYQDPNFEIDVVEYVG